MWKWGDVEIKEKNPCDGVAGIFLWGGFNLCTIGLVSWQDASESKSHLDGLVYI
jgi:hypothetical protein